MNIQQVLKRHAIWVEDHTKGQQADLRSADLGGADLQDANLEGADLRSANLGGADLQDANLEGADLQDANLRGADLRSANLRGADLGGANLRSANLRSANLRSADLGGADLQDANLRGADLRSANLRGAGMQDAKIDTWSIVPETGSFKGWKKGRNGEIVKLLIPACAERISSLVGRKCRASQARVLEIWKDGKIVINPEYIVHSSYQPTFQYQLHKTVKVLNFNTDYRIECAEGIHFFITRKEAEDF